jgi:glycosyltransferase involved in cell wall biosynthesis
LSGRVLQDGGGISREQYVEHLRVLLMARGCSVVYISRLKQEDWGIPGTVIPSAIDTAWYGGYRGDERGILQVCNHLRARHALSGWETHRTVCRDLPTLVLGDNPGLPASRKSESWEDLKEQYRSWRVYLYTAPFPYEDGYNLALLEAMATGMPVATLKHPTSPVTDGLEGCVCATAAELRSRVLWLLDHPLEAHRMGAAGRAKIESAFPLAAFRKRWESCAAQLLC